MRQLFRRVAVSLALFMTLSACGSPVTSADQAQIALQAGLNAHRAGDLEAASAFYRQALTYDPRNKFAFYNLGLIDQTTGDLVGAATHYRTALEIDPNFAPALFNLALVVDAGGDRDEALELYRRVTAIEPQNAGAHMNLGLLLRRLGRTAEGDAEVALALELDPTLGGSADPSPTPAEP